MESIETIIFVILLLMAVPDLCRKIGRPALANVFFVLFGIMIEPLAKAQVVTMLIEAGKVGFLLVLFEVGLEINLPPFKRFFRPLRFAILWVLLQYPLVLGLADLAGLQPWEALMATIAITGCSMSMAFNGWKSYPGLTEDSRNFTLQIMVALEMLTIVLLAAVAPALSWGIGWSTLFNLAGIAVAIYLISRFAAHFTALFQKIIQQTTHWRVHFLVLLVLGICAVGERLGLSAAKTAFFLGLFMSRAEFEHMNIEEHIAPISQRFLIPIFFVSLGLMVNPAMLFSYTALLALCGAGLLIGFREIVHRRWLKTGGDMNSHLLLSPNLTMASLAAASLFSAGRQDAASWTVLMGLFTSVLAIVLLPKTAAGAARNSHAPQAARPVDTPQSVS